jgi:RNA-directed DNA polymerase
MSEAFDVPLLSFRTQRKRKRGTNQWYIYTFIADRTYPVGEG